MEFDDIFIIQDKDEYVIANYFIFFGELEQKGEKEFESEILHEDGVEIARLNKSDFLKLKKAINEFELD